MFITFILQRQNILMVQNSISMSPVEFINGVYRIYESFMV